MTNSQFRITLSSNLPNLKTRKGGNFMLAEKLKKVLSKFDLLDLQIAEIKQRLDKQEQVSEVKEMLDEHLKQVKKLHDKFLDVTVKNVVAEIISKNLLTGHIDPYVTQSIREAMLPYQEEQAKLSNHYQKLFEKFVGNEVEEELASVINKKEGGK